MGPALAVLLAVVQGGPVVVHAPFGSGLTWETVEELQPGAWSLQRYEGTNVAREPGEVIVVLETRVGLGARGRLAASEYERRLVVVYVKEVERLLGTDLGNPRARVALGRIIAHELEHVRRQSADHDTVGFFKSCFSREYLLSLGR